MFEDCVKYCHSVLNKQHEFKGTIEEFVEIQVEKENGSGLETIERRFTLRQQSMATLCKQNT